MPIFVYDADSIKMCWYEPGGSRAYVAVEKRIDVNTLGNRP